MKRETLRVDHTTIWEDFITMFTLRICTLFVLLSSPIVAGEEDIAAFFEKAGARITKNSDGAVIKLMSGGRPPHTVAELQTIRKSTQLEQLALNAPAAGDDDWKFLHDLKNLKQLTIWHGKEFSSLKQFSNLPIEGLTVGGCMGIRDLNKDTPEKQRDAVLSLTKLPNLVRLNLYHSPQIPDDTHLAHIAKEFPKLQELKMDLGAPRGTETNISPDGLRKLKALPLTLISFENVKTLTPEHMKAIGEITTLKVVLIDARREDIDLTPLVKALETANPELDVQVAEKGATAPPSPSKK